MPFATTGSVGAYSIASRVVEVGLLADDDAVHRRRGLQARGGVDDVARDHRLAERGPGAEGDDGLARVDGDPDLQVASGELARDVADDECGTHGTLGVVAVGERRAEDAHHRVADELLDDASERLDLAPDTLVVRRQHRANILGVELLGPRGEADEVDEDDRDDPPLVGRRERCSVSGAPQARQKRATAGFSCAHLRADDSRSRPLRP